MTPLERAQAAPKVELIKAMMALWRVAYRHMPKDRAMLDIIAERLEELLERYEPKSGADHPVPENERGPSWFGNDGRDCCTIAAMAALIIILAACTAPQGPQIDPWQEPCKPATGAGQCNLSEPESACVCGWPPFWQR